MLPVVPTADAAEATRLGSLDEIQPCCGRARDSNCLRCSGAFCHEHLFDATEAGPYNRHFYGGARFHVCADCWSAIHYSGPPRRAKVPLPFSEPSASDAPFPRALRADGSEMSEASSRLRARVRKLDEPIPCRDPTCTRLSRAHDIKSVSSNCDRCFERFCAAHLYDASHLAAAASVSIAPDLAWPWYYACRRCYGRIDTRPVARENFNDLDDSDVEFEDEGRWRELAFDPVAARPY